MFDRSIPQGAPLPEVIAAALRQDPRDPGEASAWELAILRRYRVTRALYEEQARLLAASNDPEDRRLAEEVTTFRSAMRAADTGGGAQRRPGAWPLRSRRAIDGAKRNHRC